MVAIWRFPDHDALVADTKANILSTAFDPERAYESLGLEYTAEDRQLYAEQHQQQQDDDLHWREIAYRWSDKGRREAAGVKGAATAAANREARQAAAIEKHVGPLSDQMQTIYRQNVDKGLQHGSPFEDKMAFADALHELQDDGWNPEAGKAYRSSKEFRKLEKQLLNGRKPTRRYRQLRDALCDNEQEYKRFMTANPDVFDPDEKIVKPFAGLGSTVGQQAMLRLAAKHRGADGALRLARRDPDIDYVVGDTGSKTYRVEHHHPYTTFDEATGVYTTHDSPISANGIKPASVMGWIHNERVDDPENGRERERFGEAFGGDWEPADV